MISLIVNEARTAFLGKRESQYTLLYNHCNIVPARICKWSSYSDIISFLFVSLSSLVFTPFGALPNLQWPRFPQIQTKNLWWWKKSYLSRSTEFHKATFCFRPSSQDHFNKCAPGPWLAWTIEHGPQRCSWWGRANSCNIDVLGSAIGNMRETWRTLWCYKVWSMCLLRAWTDMKRTAEDMELSAWVLLLNNTSYQAAEHSILLQLKYIYQ